MAQEIPTSVSDFETSLSSQAVAGDTSITLTSIVDIDGNNLPAGLYAFTLDGDIEQYKEYVIGTLAGSTLSNVMSVSAQGVEAPNVAKYHRRGALVSMTDWVVLGKVVNALRGTQGLDPASPIFYDSAPASLSGNQIPTVDYVLSVVNGGTVSFQQQVFASQIAGENLTALDHIYFKESDQRWWKVDADDTATYQQVKRGIALSTQTTGGALSIAVSGIVNGFSGLTPGSKYYASNTAGAISTSAGTNIVFVGVAWTATQLIFDVNFRDIPYGNEKDALVGGGDLGTPSSTNKFITQEYYDTGGALEMGDGADGDVTISSPTSLSRDMYYNNLVVTDTLTTNGYRIFVKDTISGAGTIKYPDANPGAAGTTSPGAGGAAYTAGGALRNVAGSAGGNNGAGVDGISGYLGSAGGAGGASATAAGGIAGPDISKQKFGIEKWSTFGVCELVAGTVIYKSQKGAGGGAGDNTSNGDGGGGGASGGIVFIAAKNWTGTFTIRAVGGNGGAGAATGNGGGGGGGGAGGTSVVIYLNKTWTGSYVLTGGTGGALGGTGFAGANGTAGTSYEIELLNLI